jgi:hypothetical protein
MADPFSLAAIGMAGSAAGSGIGAIGSLMKGQSQSQMYGYQAGIAELNAKIALQNKDYAFATGETEAQKYGAAARYRMGAIRSGEGASGIDIGSGSKAKVQEGQQTVTNIDMAQIRNNAARKAYGFEVEATQDTAQAALYTKAGSDAKTGGEIGALGSLVSGTTSVADKWLQGQSKGLIA